MGKNRKTLRVLIVQEHAVFRQALALLLDVQPDLEVVAHAASLAEARALLAAAGGRSADVAVVDLGPAGGDGLVGEIVGSEPSIAVLALVDRLDLERRALALRAGAGEVLSKGADLERILDALRRLGGRAP